VQDLCLSTYESSAVRARAQDIAHGLHADFPADRAADLRARMCAAAQGVGVVI
jgi:hypothetical protein